MSKSDIETAQRFERMSIMLRDEAQELRSSTGTKARTDEEIIYEMVERQLGIPFEKMKIFHETFKK